MEIKVVLADDHKIVRQGLRVLLEAEPEIEIVGEAPSGDIAAEMVGDLHPDVLVTDLRMPGLSGIELTREVRKSSPKTLIIVLSMYADEVYVQQAIEAGAMGYVLKDASVDELTLAIHEALAGRSFISPAVHYKYQK